ncbi:MAG: heme ABC transporter permease CcmB, partial [Actinobacteria bacterium]
ILRKDLMMELRTFEMLTSMGLFALLTMLVYRVTFAAAGSALDVRSVASGLLWAALVFTSMLGLNRSLVHEKDQGCLEALLLSPVDRPVIFFAKAVGNFIFLVIVETLTVPVFWFMFLQGAGAKYGGAWYMLPLALLAGAAGIAGIGTMLATISVNTKGKDFVLAVLFVPLIYPLLLAVVSATTIAVMGPVAGGVSFWVWMGWATGYDVVMVLAAFGLYEFVIGA